MLTKAKIAVSIVKQYYKNIKLAKFFVKQMPNKKQRIFFDLHSVLAEPYYFNLLFIFTIVGGYEAVIKHHIRFIGNLSQYAKPLLSLAKISFIKPNNALTITDKPNVKSSIVISPDYYSYVLDKETEESQFLFPYLMHPNHYISGEYKKVIQYRERERGIKVFFSGNQDKEAYSNPILPNTFKKFTRIHLLNTLEERLDKKYLTYNLKQESSKEKKVNKLYLNKWTWSPKFSQSIQSRIQNESWLQTLSNVDFFLAPSGITMPLCFNLIEAMSVGTIPILQHPEHLNPPLVHLENAIVFHDEDDLLEKITLVLDMPEVAIEKLRKNVSAYYDEYLAPESVMESFKSKVESISKIIINLEYPSYAAYLKKL